MAFCVAMFSLINNDGNNADDAYDIRNNSRLKWCLA